MHQDKRVALVVLLGLGGAPCVANAAEVPAFRAGYWEFKRAVDDSSSGKPRTLTKESCVDPTADMKKMNEALVKQGCSFSAVEKAGDTYTFTSECHVEGIAVKTRSILTVDGDSAYRVEVTTTAGARSTEEVLRARRLGDC